MAADRFCLQWNNFQTKVVSELDIFRSEEYLVDVTLCCKGYSKFRAHKIILSASSPYFRNVFKENPCQHPVVILKDVLPEDVEAILNFVYQGVVNIPEKQLPSFLQTAELLQIKGLFETTSSLIAKASKLTPPQDNAGRPPTQMVKVKDEVISNVTSGDHVGTDKNDMAEEVEVERKDKDGETLVPKNEEHAHSVKELESDNPDNIQTKEGVPEESLYNTVMQQQLEQRQSNQLITSATTEENQGQDFGRKMDDSEVTIMDTLMKEPSNLHLGRLENSSGQNGTDGGETGDRRLGILRFAAYRYSCDQCEYKATINSVLEVHKRTHTGEKPYSCDRCEYKAARRDTLRDHLKVHTGEKPYACNQCDYRATQGSNLRGHMRSRHTGEKPYSCDQCDYRSASSSVLRQHMRRHIDKKPYPYSCYKCIFKATNARTLARHISKFHNQSSTSFI